MNITDPWFLLRCTTTGQTRYIEHVRTRFPDVTLYVPHYPRLTRPHGHRHPITIPTPVYPGYIFINLDPTTQSLRSIALTPPRAYYVRFNGKIEPVSPLAIAYLKEKESKNLLMVQKTIVDPYKPGKRVVIHLPVADIQAIIVKCVGTHHVSVDTPFSRITVPKAKISVVQG
jgi:transcription antitermination factor NusG